MLIKQTQITIYLGDFGHQVAALAEWINRVIPFCFYELPYNLGCFLDFFGIGMTLGLNTLIALHGCIILPLLERICPQIREPNGNELG